MTVADYEKELRAEFARARERRARGELQFDGDARLGQAFDNLLQERLKPSVSWPGNDDQKTS